MRRARAVAVEWRPVEREPERRRRNPPTLKVDVGGLKQIYASANLGRIGSA